MIDRPGLKGKRQKVKKLYLAAVTSMLLLLCTAGSAFSAVEYQAYSARYHRDMSLGQEGMQHLRAAATLLEALPRTPFDALSVQKAGHEFASATGVFIRLAGDLKSLPGISMSVPTYGAQLRAALRVLPPVIEISQAGLIACNILDLLISRLHDSLNTAQHGLTMADLTLIGQEFQQIKAALNLVNGQLNHLGPSDLQLDPRLGKLVATFHKELPRIQAWFATVEQLLPIAPTLLGIGTPANYLIEVLDSTELRPGGGFIGNYGIVTLSGGRLAAAHITDTYLLDRPFEAAGKSIPYPPAYSWFDIGGSSWSLRDSNLDADFPTAARYGEITYKQEGGSVPLQGVIAITPAFIQHALAITGPISVPEYHETVTVRNLIDRIHYYQLGPVHGSSIIPSPDGLSSTRKHFTALLAEHFLARARRLPPSDASRFLPLVVSAVHAKDIQVFFNSSVAEGLLRGYQLDSAIRSPGSNSLFIVDANISPNKANSFITDTLNDQVTIDAEGNTAHRTTISYTWKTIGPMYGGNPTYRDYVHVYMPPGSTLHTQDGWQPRGSSKAFGREVWAGFFTLSFGQTNTITLVWTVAGAARKDAHGWHYQYLIQRQAGARWKLELQVALPSCAVLKNTWGGLVSSKGQAAVLKQPLYGDVNVGIDYTC